MALLARVEALESENAALQADNTILRLEVADLRSRLNLNIKNSHKPPSSDVLTNKPGLSKGPAKKSGGQFGHKGKTLKMVDIPDAVLVHHIPSCPCSHKVFSAISWFTYLFAHKKCGRLALDCDDSLLKDFQNRAVHDCWESYFGFKQCQHSLCCPHLQRELTNLVGKGSKWATQMHRFILDLYQISQKATPIVADKQSWEQEFKYSCQLANQGEPLPKQGWRGKPKDSKGRNLLNLLVEYQNGLLDFAFIHGIPFSNNQAECDNHCLKTKQKVATNFQTLKGAKYFALFQSYTSTLHKHSMNVFTNLINVFDGKSIVFQVG